MLLTADWDDGHQLQRVDDPAEVLSAPRFFEDLLTTVMRNAPVDLHQEIRRRKDGEPLGGFAPPNESVAPEE